jgi:very-short-patch-repair endonuclease
VNISNQKIEQVPLVEGDLGGANQKGLLTVEGRLPYNPKLKDHARELRKNQTKTEIIFWSQVLKPLMKNFPELRFLRQRPIHHFIVDFYCAKLKLVIEVDGTSHNEKKEYDAERTAILNGYGITVLRYTNHEILNNAQAVYQNLLQKI